jgi:RNA polymerase sigma-70 factor (ECF subfamily)
LAQPTSHDARFERLFADHRDAVWKYCCRRVHRNDVADAVAEVFLVAWRRIDQVPDEPEASLWLYGVARNVIRNMKRATVRRQRFLDKLASLRQAETPSVEIQVVRRAQDRELLAAVARLKPLEQELLRLRTWEELSLAEIAAVVGSSARSVESRLARVRRKLAASLEVPSSEVRVVSPRPVEEGGER